MTAQRPKQTEQDSEDNKLILYRLDRVEAAVKDVSDKLDKQDIFTKSDLIEFRETIIGRIIEVRTDLQKQIDGKADKRTVEDLRTLVKAVGATLGSIITGLTIFYLTKGK